MSIFESLENLEVSEACFEEIMDIIEEILGEGFNLANTVQKYAKGDNRSELYNKARKIPSVNDINYDENDEPHFEHPEPRHTHMSKGEQGRLKNTLKQLDKSTEETQEYKRRRDAEDSAFGNPRAVGKSIIRHHKKVNK